MHFGIVDDDDDGGDRDGDDDGDSESSTCTADKEKNLEKLFDDEADFCFSDGIAKLTTTEFEPKAVKNSTSGSKIKKQGKVPFC